MTGICTLVVLFIQDLSRGSLLCGTHNNSQQTGRHPSPLGLLYFTPTPTRQGKVAISVCAKGGGGVVLEPADLIVPSKISFPTKTTVH